MKTTVVGAGPGQRQRLVGGGWRMEQMDHPERPLTADQLRRIRRGLRDLDEKLAQLVSVERETR